MKRNNLRAKQRKERFDIESKIKELRALHFYNTLEKFGNDFRKEINNFKIKYKEK